MDFPLVILYILGFWISKSGEKYKTSCENYREEIRVLKADYDNDIKE